MRLVNRSAELCSRRLFLFTIPAVALASRGDTSPAEPITFNDAATDAPVMRLTDPQFSSFLPPYYGYAVSRKGDYLVYASDVTGRMEAYRLDLKKHESRQITEAESLGGLTLLPDNRAFLYIDGGTLFTASVSSLRPRELYRCTGGFSPVPGIGVSIDGLFAAIVERNNDLYRLQLIDLRKGTVVSLAQTNEPLRNPQPRPKRASVLYHRGPGVWLANYDGKQNYRLRLAPGETGPSQWSPDGRTILYLNYPDDPSKLHNIREFVPDTNEDRYVADTTQYISFRANTDASMFVGASGSKASPYVLLLARKVNRELTLCEHRASDPDMVSPIFSRNSQQVFFTSDMHGKPALYSMDVAKLVEQTEDLA